MDDIMAITLFRHGMTEDNKRHAYLGWSDSPLCSDAALSAHPESFDQLFSSDLGRCLETGKILLPGKIACLLPELREMNFGKWEGQTYEQLKGDPFYQKWLADPFGVKPPNGESFAEFSSRVGAGWNKIIGSIIDLGVKRTAVITHGGVVRHLLMQYAPQKKGFWEWRILHGHGYELTWEKAGLRRGERCISLREVPLMANQSGYGDSIN